MRKANLSLNTIIIAALSLIVLIVLVLIFTGKVRIFKDNALPTCIDMGGNCLPTKGGVCADEYNSDPNLPIYMITRGCDPEGGLGEDEERGPCCLPAGAR